MQLSNTVVLGGSPSLGNELIKSIMEYDTCLQVDFFSGF